MKLTGDHIRALGTNSREDDRRFATVRRVSEINQGLYRTFASPVVRAAATKEGAALMRQTHPNRMRFHMFADDNPLMQPVAG